MRYKAIIFDLDGVICSTDMYHYKAWKQLADKLQIPFNEDINHRLRGVSRMESLEIILEQSKGNFTEEEKQKLANEKNEFYIKLLAQMSEKDLSKEVSDTLKQLRKKGIELAIGSSSRNAPYILERIGLQNFFDVVVDGNMIKYSKPDPEVFVKAAQKLGYESDECLVVEDAAAGVQSAISGGFDCAGIGQAAKAEGITYSLQSLCDLITIM
ncbi:MAG TPA: beta-phosphoglucomutase [Lachnoclostridium phytofermentans]|uniref:Beta-phosphoglucomutase n=1 Tax=Lachnoclostridium phytofermentans TaxID=66219 RepID=A0A3D2X3V8_9FIRM|nr:beta-phosphoglucomutase [Lachnoclostridium sp.]HCL01792.1 beta-phosphoglucomutase [Lachnoclostridium phytofermentans]